MARFIQIPRRPASTTLLIVALWFAFYASFTLFRPALLDDADSVHAEVAREMLLRHDYVTLYANGIRYLEKAPLLYWSMAASMRTMQTLRHPSARALAVAARIPMALFVLALAFAVEIFARRIFGSVRAGLYAGLILLSCPGIFLFSRILLPDVMLCLWITMALLCFWQTEEAGAPPRLSLGGMEQQSMAPSSVRAPFIAQPHRAMNGIEPQGSRLLCYGFAACCALGVLTKGLIGIVFPIAIAAIYLLLTRGLRGAIHRTVRLHPFTSFAVFLAIAAPWHILAAWANPTRGRPGDLKWMHGHWFVPMPTPGNVHGWAWFYFVNEQVLRYLNLRVPRDYDTVPLWLFWGLCLVWLMPWSAFIFKALGYVKKILKTIYLVVRRPQSRDLRSRYFRDFLSGPNALLLLTIAAAVPLLFFSLSTRQEYYVLPSLPPFAILIAGWLTQDARVAWTPVTEGAKRIRRANLRCTAVLVAFGAIFAAASIYFLLHTRAPAPDTDLAALLQQNPGDYALSMGHFLDLDALALGLFRPPLVIAAASLFLGPLASYLLRRRLRPHAATLALSAGAFGFLLAAHLALQTFAPVLSSRQLAAAIAAQLAASPGESPALIVVHQEYEYGSTLGFYLQRPGYQFSDGKPRAINPIHILTEPQYNGVRNYGRSSNLWYGSFFPDAPDIFETQQSLAAKWRGPQRIFLWQDLANQPAPLPAALSPLYVIATSGGKEIVSNQPNR
ncbi:MAG TPA: phospholipid carrier-dependent glycosyltransferase [Acidobacteriaceae bacterium]|nr:phospholipid carrier-dependent glycosyltransferase [Acidobacteriaceae bacterium]